MAGEYEFHDDNTPPPPPVTPTQQAPHTLSTIKLLILKKGEYDIWVMKMEHYLEHTDYPIWEVIQKGNAIKFRFGGNDESKKMQKYILKQQFESFSVSNSEGLHKGYDRFQSLLSQLEIHGAGVSTEDANQKFLRSLPASWSQVSLIMRTKPGVDTLSFDDLYNNLRVFESDIKGSTASSSSTQNVAFVSSESTNSTNDVSTAYGVSTSSGHNSQKEGSSSYTDELKYSFFANQSSGPQLDHEDLEQVDEFDLEEMDLKWQVAMISMRLKKFYKKTGRRLQFDAKEPVGFDKTKVECFNCHNTGHFARECRSKGNQESRRRDAGNTGYKAKDNGRRPGKQEEPKALVTLDGEEGSSSYTDELKYSFFANQSSGPQLDHEDLKQVDEFDLEEMDLKWQVAMISMRLKKSKGNQERRRRDAGNTGYKAKDNGRRPGKQEEPKALVTLDRESVDWTSHAEDEEQLGDSSIEIQAYTQALKNVEAQLVAHQKNQLWYEEKIRFMKIDLDDKTDVLTYHKKLLAEAVIEKEVLKTKLENFQSSSKGLSKLINSQMSTRDKSGLGYGNQIHEGILSYEKEVLESVFDSRSSDVEDTYVNDRFAKVKGMCAVPPPMKGNYMPPKSDFGIDESNFTYGPNQSITSESDAKTSDFDSCETNSSVETLESVPEPVVVKPKVVSQPKVWSDAPIIKEYKSDSDDEYVIEPSKEQEKPRYGFNKKACFVCGSFSHLIRDCDFHEKRMAKQVELNKKKGKGTGQGENRPVWNNVQRLNHQNKFVPKAVLTKTGIFSVNTARQNPFSQAAETSTARKVNTARPIVNEIRPRNTFYKSHSPIRRPFNKSTAPKANFTNHKVNTAGDKTVSAVRGYRETAVKASAGCNWRPKRHYWTKVSKYNSGSNSNKNVNFKDPLGRPKSAMAWKFNLSLSNHMANLEFCNKHNMIAYLQKPEGSEGFHQIIDFLNASHIQYALIENPIIYVSFIKQFWSIATARTSATGEVELTATIDGQEKTITEASLRRHLKLEDNGGVTTLPNSEIFKQLALIGYETDSDKLTFQKGNFSPQ
ncbi:ribonuclease H-like domain-containing protein [Tanacetum coccineum]